VLNAPNSEYPSFLYSLRLLMVDTGLHAGDGLRESG
jgi:hypothetical protein